MTKLLMISADGHVNPRPEDYAGLLEAKYRDQVDSLKAQTKVFFDNTWLIAKSEDERNIVDPANKASMDCKEGLWNPQARLANLQKDGFVAEILFPGDPASIGMYFMNTSDPYSPEYRAAGVRAYNRWLADYCSAAPERLLGVAQTEPWPDMGACITEIELAKRNGMVAVALPRYPGIEANQPPLYDRAWEPFWAACAANDLVVSIHLGHMRPQGGLLESMVELNTFDTGFTDWGEDGVIFYEPARRPLWQIIMSGVFDRYPTLKVNFSEIRTDWIAPTLAHLEMKFEETRFSDKAASLPKLRPTDYWRRNCSTSHMLNPYDTALRHQFGVETLMFASDYPHIEGCWPNTREWLRLAMKGVPEAELRMILGETAARVYNVDVKALQPHVDAYGLEVSEILGDHVVPPEFVSSFNFRSIFSSRGYKYDVSEVGQLIDEDHKAVFDKGQQPERALETA